jgi:hypothetical protein
VAQLYSRGKMGYLVSLAGWRWRRATCEGPTREIECEGRLCPDVPWGHYPHAIFDRGQQRLKIAVWPTYQSLCPKQTLKVKASPKWRLVKSASRVLRRRRNTAASKNLPSEQLIKIRFDLLRLTSMVPLQSKSGWGPQGLVVMQVSNAIFDRAL